MRTPQKFIACLTLISLTILLTGCETNISDACASMRKIQGDIGWQKRWTRGEMEQIDEIDTWLGKNCSN